jgi:hypothetical protein
MPFIGTFFKSCRTSIIRSRVRQSVDPPGLSETENTEAGFLSQRAQCSERHLLSSQQASHQKNCQHPQLAASATCRGQRRADALCLRMVGRSRMPAFVQLFLTVVSRVSCVCGEPMRTHEQARAWSPREPLRHTAGSLHAAHRRRRGRCHCLRCQNSPSRCTHMRGGA